MSSNDLIEQFGMGSEKQFYDQMSSLDDDSFKKTIQHTNITREEVRMYSDYFMISEQFDMPWLKEVALNDLLLLKSRDGWLVKIKSGILQKISNAISGAGDAIGEVSHDIKEAFT